MVVVLLLVVAMAATPAAGVSSSTVVAATVPSATNLDASGCPAAAPATSLGTVLPGASAITTADCTVVFGSSNDTSMLRINQTDRIGNGMWRPANTVAPYLPFDTDGRQTAVAGTASTGYAVVRADDGSLFVVGSATMASSDWIIAKFTPSGAPDTSWDGDGIVTTDFFGESDIAYDVALQPDGKLVVVGQGMQSGQNGAGIARYNANGSLDTSFDGDGRQYLDVFTYQMRHLYAVALQPDGKIVGAGYGGNTFAIIRLTAAGALDTTFNGTGRIMPSITGSTSYARSVLVQADGKIVAAGDAYVDAASNYDFGIVRLTSAGALDTSFDSDGMTTTFLSTSTDIPEEVVQTTQGKYVLMGSRAGTSTSLVRYNANGSLDTTFGTSGITTFATPGAGLGGLQQQDGSFVVVSGNGGDFGIARYTAEGAVDITFDGDGYGTAPVGDGSDVARDLVPTGDGRLAVAGAATVGGQGRLGITELGGTTTIDDYATPASDWLAGPNVFGACLHTATGAIGDWPVAGTGNCTTSMLGNWRGIKPTASTTGAKVAHATSGTQNATVALRFGMRTASSQAPGYYAAPITFDVVAPDV